MENIYIFMIGALALLAVVDLVVGVSNDAVNFLNSAIGSKALSIRNIMIIASFGVAIGAVTSSGMMEVARKGIFVPGEYYFDEIMYIFMAVMITDVLLLDLFNTLGMPTSTTVSIVFELLGAAVAMALIKIADNPNETFADLGKYINNEKALLIIMGILLSVVVAFSVGAIVQFVSRLIFSFNFDSKPAIYKSLFGGVAITAIVYFIVVKGLKGTPFYGNVKGIIEESTVQIIGISFFIWTLLSYVWATVFKKDIFKIIIGIGTFSLAIAFSGNDLVNFIGVPIAAWNSYEAWVVSGVPADEFGMGILASKVPSNTVLLLVAGGIMVVTLWTSKKSKNVIQTELSLSNQGDSHNKFEANSFSRAVVRFAVILNSGLSFILPKKTRESIDSKFQKPVISLPRDKDYELPAFDMIRASVNLMVAGILISIGTSYKLPLSTTYVTFMVAMGTSLADRAWGRDSAVYRVAGVLNVIGGWFGTAIIAFTASSIIAYLISLGGIITVVICLMVVIGMLYRNYMKYNKKSQAEKKQVRIERAELISIQGVVQESSSHISEVARRVNKMFTNVVNDLALSNVNKLKKTDKQIGKLNSEIDDLKDGVFYFIKSLDDSSVEASRFYVQVLGYLQDVAQSISYISRASYKHVNNNHKPLKVSQIKDLKRISYDLDVLLSGVQSIFDSGDFDRISELEEVREELYKRVSDSIESQISRIRSEESSPRNTTLYFSVLLETKDLISGITNMITLYEEFNEMIERSKS
ncbi:MAG: inorganic phosphate transporter [Flavobacteriaceae bacterium]